MRKVGTLWPLCLESSSLDQPAIKDQDLKIPDSTKETKYETTIVKEEREAKEILDANFIADYSAKLRVNGVTGSVEWLGPPVELRGLVSREATVLK
ncbi:hypothetical protein PIB30_064600 [Stylosanthes scabra]|uniref:Uncharacterized protein n=1 Tax=Stylosanthes scabra TaxID=79078 RepID=A0ABU6ZKI0_9FABA|nr:hypothetical protein [Stylosanthes scabra]